MNTETPVENAKKCLHEAYENRNSGKKMKRSVYITLMKKENPEAIAQKCLHQIFENRKLPHKHKKLLSPIQNNPASRHLIQIPPPIQKNYCHNPKKYV